MKIEIKNINKQTIFAILVILLQIIMFYNYIYGDILITTTHGISFWDCLFSGKITEYYKVNFETELVAGIYSGNYGAAYDFIIYIIFGIWDFPLWVSQHFFGVEHPLNTLLGNMWAKSIVLCFYILTMIVMKKLLDKVKTGNSNKIVLFMTTSIFVSAYICIIGQYDIVTVFFMLLGIYWLINNKVWYFILAFSIAIPTKVLALIAFVPVLILYEKKIHKILSYLIVAIVPMLAFRLLIPMQEGKSNVNSFFQFLFINNIPVGNYKISLFIFFYVALLCYFKKKSDNAADFTKEVIYISFIAYAIFFLFAYTFPYWMVYMLPYIYITIATNSRQYICNLVLEIFMSFSIVVAQSITFYWLFSSNILSNFVWGKLGFVEQGYSIVEFIKSVVGEDGYSSAQDYILQSCWSVFVIMTVIFAILNYPFIKRKKNYDMLDCKENRNILYVIRALMVAVIYFIPFLYVIA